MNMLQTFFDFAMQVTQKMYFLFYEFGRKSMRRPSSIYFEKLHS